MKLLGIFAHPDDESIIIGGTIAKAVSLGHEATLLCATPGEASTAYDRDYSTFEELPELRTKEFHEACRYLGAQGILLNFKDGTLAQMPESEGTAELLKVIKAQEPDIIITFEPKGISFHSDHKTIHRWVMEALKDSWFDQHQVDVYWVTVNQNAGRKRDDKLMGHPADQITSRVLIEPWKNQKQSAILAHRTQWTLFQRAGLVVDGELGRNFMYEYYIKVNRDGNPEVETGNDIFDVYGEQTEM